MFKKFPFHFSTGGAPSLCKYKGWWDCLDSSGKLCRFWRATYKFNPTPSLPRPVLVKFIQISDVSSILSKKDCFGHLFSIKSDLTPEERPVTPLW